MNIQFSFKNVSIKDKSFLEEYTDKKIERITNLLQDHEVESSQLEIRTEKFTKKEAYKLEVYLSFPGQSFMASEDDHTVIEAFDLALDKLIIQLRKWRDEKKRK